MERVRWYPGPEADEERTEKRTEKRGRILYTPDGEPRGFASGYARMAVVALVVAVTMVGGCYVAAWEQTRCPVAGAVHPAPPDAEVVDESTMSFGISPQWCARELVLTETAAQDGDLLESTREHYRRLGKDVSVEPGPPGRSQVLVTATKCVGGC